MQQAFGSFWALFLKIKAPACAQDTLNTTQRNASQMMQLQEPVTDWLLQKVPCSIAEIDLELLSRTRDKWSPSPRDWKDQVQNKTAINPPPNSNQGIDAVWLLCVCTLRVCA